MKRMWHAQAVGTSCRRHKTKCEQFLRECIGSTNLTLIDVLLANPSTLFVVVVSLPCKGQLDYNPSEAASVIMSTRCVEGVVKNRIVVDERVL
jgi:hypothetical protein